MLFKFDSKLSLERSNNFKLAKEKLINLEPNNEHQNQIIDIAIHNVNDAIKNRDITRLENAITKLEKLKSSTIDTNRIQQTIDNGKTELAKLRQYAYAEARAKDRAKARANSNYSQRSYTYTSQASNKDSSKESNKENCKKWLIKIADASRVSYSDLLLLFNYNQKNESTSYKDEIIEKLAGPLVPGTTDKEKLRWLIQKVGHPDKIQQQYQSVLKEVHCTGGAKCVAQAIIPLFKYLSQKKGGGSRLKKKYYNTRKKTKEDEKEKTQEDEKEKIQEKQIINSIINIHLFL